MQAARHLLLNVLCQLIRFRMQVPGAGEIQVGIVQRGEFHCRSVAQINFLQHQRSGLVVLEIAFQEYGLRAEAFGLHQGHAGAHPAGACLVAGGVHHPALIFRSAHNYRFAPQQGIESLLHRGEKRIGIDMGNEARRTGRIVRHGDSSCDVTTSASFLTK